ncbi:MAG: XrtA system polysaccharide deacetylase [Terriglobales bacterium]
MDAPEPKPGGQPVNGLSVDVEDYYHVEAFADRITPEMWPTFPSRVADNTRRVLELFAQCGARATFFVLAYVVEREPGLVREIQAAGHEVGCHSHLHRCIFRLTPEEFRADTRRARKLLEDAGGREIAGYRAPTFSITRRSLWALDILAEEGFLYDSSVFPVHHDVYGIPEAPRFAYQWEVGNGGRLYEIPPLTFRFLGRNLPLGGGGYLRILPMWYTRWGLGRVRQEEQPAVMYLHPWELDPGQPRLEGRRRSVLRHYSNLGKMGERVRELLASGSFVPLREVLEQQLARGPLPRHKPDSFANGGTSG